MNCSRRYLSEPETKTEEAMAAGNQVGQIVGIPWHTFIAKAELRSSRISQERSSQGFVGKSHENESASTNLVGGKYQRLLKMGSRMRSSSTSSSEIAMTRSVLSERLCWLLASPGSNGSPDSWRSSLMKIRAPLNCTRWLKKRNELNLSLRRAPKSLKKWVS